MINNLTKFLLLIFAFVAMTLTPCHSQEKKVYREGDAFPKSMLRAANLGSSKILIVDFWASWCAPCKKAFAFYNEIHKKYRPADLQIIAVNVDNKYSDMQKFLRKTPAQFKTLFDNEKKIVTELRPAVMPTAYVLDTNGVIRFIHKGYHGKKTDKKILEQISFLLQ